MSGLFSRGGLASGSWRLKLTADWSGWWLDIDLPSCHLQPSESSVMDTQWGLTSLHGLTAEHVSEQSWLCGRRQLQKTEQGKIAYGNCIWFSVGFLVSQGFQGSEFANTKCPNFCPCKTIDGPSDYSLPLSQISSAATAQYKNLPHLWL